MKNRMLQDWIFGLVLAALPLASGYSQEPPAQSTDAASFRPSTDAVSTIEPAGDIAPAPTEPAPTPDATLTNAAVQPLSTNRPLPVAVKPSAPAAEVIRLAESGVEQSVLLTL